MIDNPKFYKKVINNGLFPNKELMTVKKKHKIMEKIYLERNKDVVKKKRMKDAIGIAVCCFLLFFTGQFAWDFIDKNNTRSTTSSPGTNHVQVTYVIEPIPAKEGELTGEDWMKLSDHEKYNLIGDVLRDSGLTTAEINKYADLRLLKTQLDRGLKLEIHQNTGVNSAILFLYEKYKLD